MKIISPKNLFRTNEGAIHPSMDDAIKDSVWDAAEVVRNFITNDNIRQNMEDGDVLIDNKKDILAAMGDLRDAFNGKHVTEYTISK